MAGNQASCHVNFPALQLLENTELLKCFMHESDMIDLHYSRIDLTQ